MAEINLHPDDTVMSGPEVVKKAGGTLAGLLFFAAMFYALYREGEVIMALLCGAPLGLMALALASQCAMHFLGMGQMVLNEGTMTLRTSRSGKSRGKGIFASLERIILAPLFMLAMRDLDKDGDGRFSYDEMMEEMDGESKKEIMEMQELFDKAGGDDLHHGKAGCTIAETELRAITVSHLLTMRSGLAWKEGVDEAMMLIGRGRRDIDWPRARQLYAHDGYPSGQYRRVCHPHASGVRGI